MTQDLQTNRLRLLGPVALATQAVLGLVEPQSSGLGGGAFMLHYRASTHSVQSYDGRETAPAAATEDYLRFVSAAEGNGTTHRSIIAARWTGSATRSKPRRW